MKEDYLARASDHSMVQSGDGLLLGSREGRPGLRLNRTAALTWLLCDGTLRHREIVARIGDLHPDQAGEIPAEVSSLLEELLDSGRIRRVAIPGERPVLRVSFSGFWKTFDPGDNYLTWMLSCRYDVLVVEAGSVPDLQFFCSSAPPDPWDRDRTIGIFLGSASSSIGAETDFALVWDGADGEGRLQLPSWVFLADWLRDLGGHPEAERLAAYAPQRFGERFLLALEQQTAGADAPSAGSLLADSPSIHGGAGRRDGPRLTVGLAAYDDYDGVYFTVQALVLNHPEIAAQLEILIVDNHPEGPAAAALERLAGAVEGARYLAFADHQGTAVRDVVFRYARAPIVLCLDSHVLLPPGSLRRLVEYLERRPDCGDLLQGPLLYDDHRTLSTHFDPIWSEGMFGVWATDERGLDPDLPPFEIPMQGLGLFACRRQAWPGLNPRFRGFGGEEGYLHEKFRRRGARTLCLPFLRWLHRFERPGGIRFPNVWEERIRNYLIGHHELGLATIALESHFREFLGDGIYRAAETAVLAEMAGPFWELDAIYGVELEEDEDRRRRFESECEDAGLGKLLRWYRRAPIPATVPAQVRGALSHRRIVERASRLGLESILLIDCRAELRGGAFEALAGATEELRRGDWGVAVLDRGAAGWPAGVAYHQRVYRRICEELPPEPEAMAARIRERGGTFASYLDSLEGVALT